MKIENSPKKSHFSKKKYHFFSLIFHWKKWLFWRKFSDFFSSRKIFFVQLFVSKKSSNYFLKTNFWSRFFSNICAVWFPVDWARFWVNSAVQEKCRSIFVRGGRTLRFAPPLWRSLTEHFKLSKRKLHRNVLGKTDVVLHRQYTFPREHVANVHQRSDFRRAETGFELRRVYSVGPDWLGRPRPNHTDERYTGKPPVVSKIH